MISELITNYLEENKLSYRKMAAEISQQLGVPNAVTYQSISNWATGAFKPHPPLMLLLSKHGTGSMRELAQEVMKVLENEPVVQG